MTQKIKAIYHAGVFVPQTPCNLPEEAEVKLIVQGLHLIPPVVTDSSARAQLLKATRERMRQNPIPTTALRLTREILHERR